METKKIKHHVNRENIFKCNCPHEYQDEHYGSWMRLHNPMLKGSITMGWRCTVCGNIRK